MEQEALALLPRDQWLDYTHRVILFGRAICKAPRARCSACFLTDLCPAAFLLRAPDDHGPQAPRSRQRRDHRGTRHGRRVRRPDSTLPATGAAAPLPVVVVATTPLPAPAQSPVGARLLVATLLTTVVLFVLFSPWPLSAKLHAIGRSCCAQIPSHTLRIGDRLMPIDARNSGIYLGVFLAIALLWLTGRGKAGLYAPSYGPQPAARLRRGHDSRRI